jgi:hypothetical protein
VQIHLKCLVWGYANCKRLRSGLNPNSFCFFFQNYCLCFAGWQDKACERCSPYWKCPSQEANACTQPNECLCFKNETDPNNLCNNGVLIQPGMNSRPGIALPVPIFVPLKGVTASQTVVTAPLTTVTVPQMETFAKE